MSNTTEDEKSVHPLVSNLLGQKFVPRISGETFRYDRDEMLRLKITPLSTTRPDILSTDFDGEDGKFSPYKWLEYRWEVEGIKNRPPNKKLQDALRAECDENSGLSPQRRGFSGGCRAPPSEDRKEKEGIDKVPCKDEGWSTVENRDHNRERSSAGPSSKWKSTVADKFNNGKSNDFKLPFQKSTSTADKNNRPTSWKTVEGKEKQSGSFSSTGKFLPARSYRADDRGERIPEWADGPTTMDDMIELKGFDEPTKNKKKNGKADKQIPKTEKEKNGSRPSSRGNASGIESDKTRGPESNSTKNEAARTTLPVSDVELAELLGLMDLPTGMPSSSKSEKTAEGGLSGSRMSRFFKNVQSSASTVSDAEPTKENGGPGFSGGDEAIANPMLAKIFSHTPTDNSTPGSAGKSLPPAGGRTMRLEDLERNYVQNRNVNMESAGKIYLPKVDEDVKGNPLQDPHQQAQFLQKLQEVAKQQKEATGNSGSPPPSKPQQVPGASIPPMGPHQMQMPGMFPQMTPNHILQAQAHAHAQQLLAMQMHNFPGGCPPEVVDRVRNDMLRNLIARQHMQAAVVAHQQAQAAAQQSKQPPVRAPAMIPSSVQRHLTKSSVGHSDEKRERNKESEDVDPSLQNARNQNDALKKMQMQQQYTALMSAMQNGLPMAALRQGAPHPHMNQTPSSQQMQAFVAAQQMAQAQQQMRLALMQKQQQQAALMKLMAIQQQQQMQQQGGGDGERPVVIHGSHGNVQSELFQQVGPIQTPLEKLLTAAGVQPSQFTGSSENIPHPPEGLNSPFADGARPMSLEELERQLTAEKSK